MWSDDVVSVLSGIACGKPYVYRLLLQTSAFPRFPDKVLPALCPVTAFRVFGLNLVGRLPNA
jgi:hypothetical protein